jgi:hypothetical protein
MQSPKRCDLKEKQDGILDKDKTMNNVQKRNICINVLLSQFFRSYIYSVARKLESKTCVR